MEPRPAGSLTNGELAVRETVRKARDMGVLDTFCSFLSLRPLPHYAGLGLPVCKGLGLLVSCLGTLPSTTNLLGI